jgi:hypothetical protein
MPNDFDLDFWKWLNDRDAQHKQGNKETVDFEPLPLYIELDIPREHPKKEEKESEYISEVDFSI